MKLIYCFCLLILLQSCTDKKKVNHLSHDILKAQAFRINPASDTILYTTQGIIIEIPAGSISSPGGGEVEIELKEALGLEEMLLAGLTTNGGENALASQGMFFIDTKTNGAKIVKSISAKIPVPNAIKGMDSYEGRFDKDSTIQWEKQKAAALPTTDDKNIARGKSLFEARCNACHNIASDGTGPQLAGLTSQRSMNWLIKYTRDYRMLEHEGDCDAIAAGLSRPSAMNTFHYLTDEDIKNIFRYVDKEANTPPALNQSFCYDTCASFRAKMSALQQKAEIVKYAADTTPNVVVNYLANRGTPAASGFTSVIGGTVNNSYLVGEQVNRSYYYQLNISGWGWYNIDILLKELPGLIPSTLIAELQGQDIEDFTISLIIPSVKCFANGGPMKNDKSKYVFMNVDGTINLPAGKDAYVIAYGDRDGKFMFASKKFIAASNNRISLQPVLSKPENLKAYLRKISKDELQTEIKNLETGKLLEDINKEMERLKSEQPSNCKCFCGEEDHHYLPPANSSAPAAQ